MRRTAALLTIASFALLAAALLSYSQTASPSASGTQPPRTKPEMPTVRLAFSQPDTDSPLLLPSMAISGPPACSSDGRAFIRFMTPPPYYNNIVPYSVSPSGDVVHYDVGQITGFTNIYVTFIDPGTTNVVLLLRAEKAGAEMHSPFKTYMALFDYDGDFESISKFDLGFHPIEVAQLYQNGYLVLGADPETGNTRLVLVDSTGTLLREFTDSLMPSDEDLTTMLSSLSFAGKSPKAFPGFMEKAMVVSLFRPVHTNEGILLLRPGARARVLEILQSGEEKTVELKLPAKEVAQTLLASEGKWFVRTSPEGSDTRSNLYEVDPTTGETLEKIDTSGTPATSIACAANSGFYGFRWINHKPYLIRGTFQ
jgi:hypothetical protein